ncbi:hypothetical protein UFOVP543_13 [uncultured Caudovirales phage]|uniref:Uncharacterized protein n=1 Tax=uncultured Caudovirales phage TaxID=2100421 RepID=A0A6J5MR31_9CAUD|nr:hypothetical protein UFOVP543_13 [uncultured Caudovirales phage]CAB4163713.1 hypothetical protein UFOVP804_41 [uncultured Caudovirales phage]
MAKKKAVKKFKKKPEAFCYVRKVLNAYVDLIEDTEVLVADGFDEAIIGIACANHDPVVIYDFDICVEILRKDMSHEDALEHMSYNVTGAYVGPRTPIFIRTIDEISNEVGI